MSFPSYDRQTDSPTTTGAPMITGRAAANFYVTPMGGGRPAKVLEKSREAEDDPVSGIGFSIMGSVIGGALGLGPMFEIAFEAMKIGVEISESQLGSRQALQDVNLNPAALIRPDLAFNFRSIPNGRQAMKEEEEAKAAASSKNKRSWNSGEGEYIRQHLAQRRSGASGPSLVPQMRGFGSLGSKC